MFDFLMADDLAGNRSIAILETVGDDQDTVTAGALGRLDHEVRPLANDLAQLVDALFGLDHAVHFRHVDAGGDGAFLGDDLVIDDRIQVALVVLQHIVRVASVDAHDAFGFKGLPGFPET
ncbi:hypothetical protein FQZ97_1083320 [compost metagenome]